MKKKIFIIILSIVLIFFLMNFFITLDANNTKEYRDNFEPVPNLVDNKVEVLDMSENNNGDGSTQVVLETNKGEVVIELNKEKAPITVANFLNYVNSDFYNNTIFHRVIKGFMIQGGGFTIDGSKKETNEPIVLESDNGLKNLKGTIAMARTNDPDSATSQFFINTVDNDFLDYSSNNPGYAVFGKVISGLDIVSAIENSPTSSKDGYQDWPVEDVIIEKAYVR